MYSDSPYHPEGQRTYWGLSIILRSSEQRLEHFWTCLLSRGLGTYLLSRGLGTVCDTQLFSYTLADITLTVS